MTQVTLTPDAERRLANDLRRLEEMLRAVLDGPPRQRGSADPVQVLKITGAATSGEYPAKLSWYDAAAATERLSEEVRFRPAASGVTLAAGDYVVGRFSGPAASDATKGLYRGASGGAPADGSFTFTVYDYSCGPGGGLIATPRTITISGPGISGGA